jgi:hypothetical protein
MRIKYVALTLAALAVVALLGARFLQQGVAATRTPLRADSTEASPPPQSPFPDVCIPGVPEKGNCCLWEIVRKVDGRRQAKYGNPYTCDMGQTRRGDMSIKMKLAFVRSVCDQQDIPPNNSTLEAKGVVIRRNDGYAYFSGEFAITDSGGKVLFKGRMETTDRLGSHHTAPACERCNPESHFEGWLVGRGTDAFPNHTLRAFIVARGTVPSPQQSSMVLSGNITGTLVKCPLSDSI